MNQIKYHYIDLPLDNASSNVLMVHGYAEHIARYKKLMNRLAQANCGVYGFDFRGHGKSSGKRSIFLLSTSCWKTLTLPIKGCLSKTE